MARREDRDTSDQTDPDLEDLLSFVRDARGFDFTGYKRSSLTRRIRKRMGDVGIDEYLDYRDLLETSADEFRSLFNTILINVTSFFRDGEAWSYLQNEVVPALLGRMGPDDEIRVWSAGCSSGEEAYTLAMVFAEAIGIEQCVRRVKIYGTDVDTEALRAARSGTYPVSSVESMGEQLRGKYFEEHGDRLAIRSDLRRRVIFGRHDITRDAPISRLHLLVCRNTLMYFNVEAQSKIVDRFTFALTDNGSLFLGKAEMLLVDGNRFDVLSMRHRVFRRRPGGANFGRLTTQPRPVRPVVEPVRTERQSQLRDMVLDSAPSAMVVVDMDGAVVQLNRLARARLGLGQPDIGRPFRDLEISYRPLELRSLIEQAHSTRRPVRVNAVERRQADEEVQYLDIVVQPLAAPDGEMLGAGIAFIDSTTLTRLQLEVKRNREELETTNEELQSTNEELETTNEELQSGNEELETMNEEMRIRTTELDETRTFLEGVLSSIAACVVVLDAELRVRSWNRGAEELWGLRPEEVRQQPFATLDFGLPRAQAAEMVERCVAGKEHTGPIELTAVNRRGRTFTCSLSCSPLQGGSGVVLLMEAVDTW